MHRRAGLLDVQCAQLPSEVCDVYRVVYDKRLAELGDNRYVSVRHGAFWPCGTRRWWSMGSLFPCAKCGHHDKSTSPEMCTKMYQISRMECCRESDEVIVYLCNPQNFSWGCGPTTETHKFTFNTKTGQIGHWHEEEYPSPVQWYAVPDIDLADDLCTPRFLGTS